MEDHNIYQQRNANKDINIFRVLFDKREFFGEENLLDKHKFNFFSSIECLEKYNIPV